MKNIDIKATNEGLFTPAVRFDADTGVCELEGESAFVDTTDFYKPLINWLEQYFETVGNPIIFNFRLSFFNTGSSRYILQILNMLKKYEDDGGQIVVNWYRDESNIDIAEEIQDFNIDTGLKINDIII